MTKAEEALRHLPLCTEHDRRACSCPVGLALFEKHRAECPECGQSTPSERLAKEFNQRGKGSYTGCHLWKRDEPTDNDMIRLETIETLVDESHQIRTIRKCPDCGQLYLWEFEEEVDWVEGNDPQYWTVAPIESVEDAYRLAECPVHFLKPRIQWQFTDLKTAPRWKRERSH